MTDTTTQAQTATAGNGTTPRHKANEEAKRYRLRYNAAKQALERTAKERDDLARRLEQETTSHRRQVHSLLKDILAQELHTSNTDRQGPILDTGALDDWIRDNLDTEMGKVTDRQTAHDKAELLITTLQRKRPYMTSRAPTTSTRP